MTRQQVLVEAGLGAVVGAFPVFTALALLTEAVAAGGTPGTSLSRGLVAGGLVVVAAVAVASADLVRRDVVT